MITGNALTPTANRVLEIAKSQVGYHEGHNAAGWNNDQKYSKETPGLSWSNFMAWCATFISWCAYKAGIATLVPQTASTDTAAAWYQARGQWSTYPAIGAQGFLAHGSDEFHTFWVYAYDDTYIWTYDGNSNTSGSPQGDGVYALKRRRADAVVEGYGYPAYPEGIISADPAWANRAPKAPAPIQKAPMSNRHLAKIKVATINCKSLPVNSDFLGTVRSAPAASVLLLQECDLDQFKHALLRLSGYQTHALHMGDNTYDSFVVFKSAVWDHVSTRFVKLYDGAGSVSYTRHIAITVLRHRATGAEFTFSSWHSVTAGKDRVRRRLRAQGGKNVSRVIANNRKTGQPFIGGADDNTPRNLHPGAKVHTHHGIDHQYAWDGEIVSLQRRESHTVATSSDHDTLVVTYAATIDTAR